MRIQLDKKKKPRASVHKDEVLSILKELGTGDLTLHAIEKSHNWVVFKANSKGNIISSASRPGKSEWIRTSFRDNRENHDRFIALCRQVGLTYCQYLRILEIQELEKFGYIQARQPIRRPLYVG